ncbi:hypothetical protein [Photorhabdus viridis]
MLAISNRRNTAGALRCNHESKEKECYKDGYYPRTEENKEFTKKLYE